MSRFTPATIVALAVLLASPALGAGATQLVDAAGDESIHTIVRQNLVALPDCDAPAADVRSVAIASDGDVVVVTLALASLAEFEADCGPVDVEATRAMYSVFLAEPAPEDPAAFANDLSFDARYVAEGWEGCAWIALADGSSSSTCAGTFAVDGDSLVWSVPLAGSALMWVPQDPAGLVVEEELVAYDLRGISVEQGASARLELASAPFLSSMVRVSDNVFSDALFTL